MGLADVVDTNPAHTPRRGFPCSVGVLERSLEGADLDALLSLLYGDVKQPPGWGRSAAEVHRLIRQAGLSCSEQQINKHRKQSCRCWIEAAA